MDVILDTNIYYSLIYSHGGQFISANPFIGLITYLRRTDSNLIIPTLVLDELLAKYAREFSQKVKEARDAYETMTRNLTSGGWWPDFEEPDLADQLDALEKQLQKPAKGFSSKIIDAYDSIPAREIARRGIERIRPANANGEELRDVMLWLMAVEMAKKGKVAFVSDDSGFQAPDHTLHRDLIDDLRKAKADVLYYTSLAKFITDNSLKSETVNDDEIAALISLAEVSDLTVPVLIRLRTSHGTIKSAEIKSTKLVGAQKYRVADDASYIEANLRVDAELLIEEFIYYATNVISARLPETLPNPFTSAPLQDLKSWNPSLFTQPLAWSPPAQNITSFAMPSSGMPFLGTPNVLAPAVTGAFHEPHLVERTFNSELATKFSIRISKGKKESLQLEELEIKELILKSAITKNPPKR